MVFSVCALAQTAKQTHTRCKLWPKIPFSPMSLSLTMEMCGMHILAHFALCLVTRTEQTKQTHTQTQVGRNDRTRTIAFDRLAWKRLDPTIKNTCSCMLFVWFGLFCVLFATNNKHKQHPNSRFTSPILNCTNLDEMHDKPEGVPIKIMLFGGRRCVCVFFLLVCCLCRVFTNPTQTKQTQNRNKDVPLVVQSFNWSHGVYLGATLSSEATSAAADLKVGLSCCVVLCLLVCWLVVSVHSQQTIKQTGR